MSRKRERAEAAASLIRKYESVDTEFVMDRLGCHTKQAREAIRQGRIILADEGYRVSYATGNNGFQVAADGDPDERSRSWLTRQQSILTQAKNSARIMQPALDHPNASREERAIARLATVSAKSAELDQERLAIVREFLSA